MNTTEPNTPDNTPPEIEGAAINSAPKPTAGNDESTIADQDSSDTSDDKALETKIVPANTNGKGPDVTPTANAPITTEPGNNNQEPTTAVQADGADINQPKTKETATTSDDCSGSMAEFPFATDKNNLFYAFDLHRKRVSRYEKYSIDIYLDYHNKFDKEKKTTLTEFRKKYEEKKFDIAILDNEPDNIREVVIDFLDWSGKLPQNGIWFYRAIHWIKSLFGKKSKVSSTNKKEDAPKRVDLSTEEKYLDKRYFVAQKFYSKRADEGKKNFFKIQKTIFALSVIIPVIALVSKFADTIITDLNITLDNDAEKKWVTPKWVMDIAPLITAILSAIIAYLSSKDKLYSWLSHWTKNRELSERLKREYSLYQGRSEAYEKVEGETIDNHTPAERLFRKNVEQIIEDGREYLSEYGSRKSAENKK